MSDFIKRIREILEGEVREDHFTKRAYSVDASIYEIEPLCVITPKNEQDVVKVVKLAAEHEISVIPRGAATGITGGCLGKGIILDFSKHMNTILHVDWNKHYIVCQPGIVQDQLNAFLAPKGFRLGPDTSTGNRATLGGMLANDAAGARSLKYGTMTDHILELNCVLSKGEMIRFKELSALLLEKKWTQQDREGEIYRAIEQVRHTYASSISSHFPKLPRRVSGYNLEALLQSPLNLSKLIVGSEGTLGIVTEMMLKIVPVPHKTGLCVIQCHDMIEGMRAVEQMLHFQPISVEMVDRHIIQAGKNSPAIKPLEWLKGDPEAIFAIEFEDNSQETLFSKLDELKKEMQQLQIGYAWEILIDPTQIAHFWELRKAGLGLLLSKRSYTRAIAFIEDLSIPPQRLADFMEEYRLYMRRKNKESGIYGHVGSGCLHIRPYINLRNNEDFLQMPTIMQEMTEIVIRYGGVLSGEHGDGLVRSWLNPQLFGKELYQAFIAIKQAFDPQHQMNPGKIVHPAPFESNHRLTPKTQVREIETFLDFSKEGGFALSADLCNGNGLCRKKEGIMCPSFQATGDEYDTTRARAQALRGIVTGRTDLKALDSHELQAILDLCLGCKGCKKECPSQVDMAKMKAELLYQYHQTHQPTLRDRLFGFIGAFNNWAAPVAGLINHFADYRFSKKTLAWLGVDPRRSLPKLSSETFSKWMKKQHTLTSERKVVLFNDTFTEFHVPHIGMKAKEVLEKLGYSVIVPQWNCCGRTLISKGFLSQAKQYAEKLTTHLIPYAEQQIPIVGLEPSCILTLRDDFFGLLGYNHLQLGKVSSLALTFDEFLYNQRDQLKELRKRNLDEKSYIFHGHCHQRALSETRKTIEILQAVLKADIQEINAGCCGMAGSFGYEKEHYDISVQIANLQLIPFLNKNSDDSILVANGFSCRQQIEHLTTRHPKHLAEVIADIL